MRPSASPGLSDAHSSTLTLLVRWSAIVVLGGLLLFAAIAKSMTGLPSQISIALAELLLVALMVVRRRDACTWFGVSLVFGTFLGYTAMRWLGGAKSCGCFGAIEVRPDVTLWIDIGAMVFAFGVGTIHAQKTSSVRLMFSVLAASAGFGMLVATLSSPPPEWHYQSQEAEQLLGSPMYAELGRDDGLAWYVYLYDPACPVCLKHLPRMRRLEASSAADELFRVRTIDIFELESQTGIPYWSWGETPIMLEIAGGRVVTRRQGQDFLDPGVVSLRYTAQGTGMTDPLAQLERSPSFGVVRVPVPEYWLVVVLDGSACETNRQQIEMFQTSVGPNDTLGVLLLSAEELEASGIARENWGSACTGVLYRHGERLAQYAGTDIPEPLKLWTDLQAGMLLPTE